MAQISKVDGSIVESGVIQESGAHQVVESPAHQRTEVPLMTATGVSITACWSSLWTSSQTSGATLATAPLVGATSVTVAYPFGAPPGSNGGTTTIGLGIGMIVTSAHYAPGTTIASISGLSVGLSLPVATGGASITFDCMWPSLANNMYPTNWDACLFIRSVVGGTGAPYINYDNIPPSELQIEGGFGSLGGTDSGTLDAAGYELYNAPSHFTVTGSGGWGHIAASSEYQVIYPATTNGPYGPVNSYVFNFGSSITLSTKQAFAPGAYSGSLSIDGTTNGVGSSFSGTILFGDITVNYDLTSGFNCSVAGVITSNTGSTAAGWTCTFTQTFTGTFTVTINLNNIDFDATYGKANISVRGLVINLTA